MRSADDNSVILVTGGAGFIGSNFVLDFVKDRPGHDRRYAMDTAKMAAEFGWRPAVLRPITTAKYPFPAARPLNAATSPPKNA